LNYCKKLAKLESQLGQIIQTKEKKNVK